LEGELKDIAEFWNFYREDFVRGGKIVLVAVLAYGGIGIGAYFWNTRELTLEDVGPGQILSITRFPTPGNYASASSMWEADVSLISGETVNVQFFYMPNIGVDVCIAKYVGTLGAPEFRAFGYIEALQREGKEC